MKKRNLIIQTLSFFAVVGVLTACSSSKKESAEKPGEPNNSILKAGMVQSGQAYSMKIDSVGDVDWYAIAVPEAGYLKISTKTVPEGLNLEVRFAEKQAWKPEKQKWISDWDDIPKTLTVKQADTLYFMIIDDHNNKSSEQEVAFKVDFITQFNEQEFNNLSENAVAVSSGGVMNTSFFPKTDKDWFKIKVDTQGYLMIRARKTPENIKINARFAKKESEFSEVEFIKGWQDLPAGIQVTEKGTYYFLLLDDYNNAMSRDKAEWKIDFIAEIDSTEPNNSYEEARSVVIGDTIKTAIFPEGDVDYFTLTPYADVTVRLVSQNPENINAEVHLYIKEDFEEKAIGDWETLPTQYKLETGQQYYFQLIDDYNNAYSKEPVILTMVEVKGEKVEKVTGK